PNLEFQFQFRIRLNHRRNKLDNQECRIEGLEHDTIALHSGFLMHQLNPMKISSYFRFH
ncbi:hypothetical protein S245_016829, partial [Arachis hypogaea]